MNGDRLQEWQSGLYALSFVCLVVIAISDSWRTAALAGIAAGAVLLTRTRFAVPCAAALSLLAAFLVISGPAVSA